MTMETLFSMVRVLGQEGASKPMHFVRRDADSRWRSTRLACLGFGMMLLTIASAHAQEPRSVLSDPQSRRPPPVLRPDTIIESPIPENLRAVHFESGAADLSDAAQQILAQQAAILRANPSDRAIVYGRAESSEVPDRVAGFNLSLARGNAVRKRLIELGVPAEQLSVKALGTEGVIVMSDTEEARKSLRRAEVDVPSRGVK